MATLGVFPLAKPLPSPCPLLRRSPVESSTTGPSMHLTRLTNPTFEVNIRFGFTNHTSFHPFASIFKLTQSLMPPSRNYRRRSHGISRDGSTSPDVLPLHLFSIQRFVTSHIYHTCTQQKAKLQLLAQVHRSTNPLIHELESIIDHPSFAEQQCIPSVCTSITSSLQPCSIYQRRGKQFVEKMFDSMSEQQSTYWDPHLESL